MMTTYLLMKIFVYFLLQNGLHGMESNDMKEIQSFLDVELNRNNENSSKVHLSNNTRGDSPNIVKRAAFEDDYYQTENHHKLPYEPFFLTTVSQYTASNRFNNYSDDVTSYSQQQRQNNYDKDSVQSTEFCRLLVSKKADSWIRNKPGTEWVCSLSVSKDTPKTFYKDDKPFLSVNVSISGWITDNHAFSGNLDGLNSTPKYYLNVGNEPISKYDSIFKNEPNYELTFTIDYPIEGKRYQKQHSVPRKEYGATIPNVTYHPKYHFYFSNEDDNYVPNMWLDDVQPSKNQGTVETLDQTQRANWINDYKQVNDMMNNVTENFLLELYPENSRSFLNEFGDQYGLLPTVNTDQQFNREIMTNDYTVENTPCFNLNEANLRVLFPPEDVYQYTTFQTWMNDFKPKSPKTPCGCVRQEEIYVMQNPEDLGYVFLCENRNRKRQSCNSFGKWLFFCSNNNQLVQNQPGTGFVQQCNNDERLTEALRSRLQQQQQQLQWQEEELYYQNVLLQQQYQSYMAHLQQQEQAYQRELQNKNSQLQQQEMTHIQLKQKAQLSFQQEQKLKEEMKLKEVLHRKQMKNQEDKFLRELEKYQRESKEQEGRLFEQLNQQQHKHQQELVKKEEELRVLRHQELQEQLSKQLQQQQNWEQQQNWQHQQDLQSYYQQQLENQRRQQEIQLELERQQQLIYEREKQEQQIHQQNYYDTQIQKQLEYQQQQQALLQMQQEYQQQTQLDYELQQQYDLRHQQQQNIRDFYYQQPYQFHQIDYNQNEDIGQQQKYLLQYPLFTGTGYACSKNHFPGWAATVWSGSIRPCINPLIESSSSGDFYEWNPCINQANNFFGFYNGRIEEVSQLANQLDEADRFYLNNFNDFENEYKIMWDKISDLFDETSFK